MPEIDLPLLVLHHDHDAVALRIEEGAGTPRRRGIVSDRAGSPRGRGEVEDQPGLIQGLPHFRRWRVRQALDNVGHLDGGQDGPSGVLRPLQTFFDQRRAVARV